MKFKSFLSIAIVFIIFFTSLTGCQNLVSSRNFADYNIGDRFESNRDIYMVKLNNSFFASVSYKETEKIEIYKLLDFNSDDLIGNSKLYFSGEFDKCYSNEDNILIKSDVNNNYILIDCNDIKNQKVSSSVDDLNVDLSAYKEII
jgi:hypothetical protein